MKLENPLSTSWQFELEKGQMEADTGGNLVFLLQDLMS